MDVVYLLWKDERKEVQLSAVNDLEVESRGLRSLFIVEKGAIVNYLRAVGGAGV